MITRNNISAILTSDLFNFKYDRYYFSKSFGEGDDKFELSYNFGSGEFIYPKGLSAGRGTTSDEHQNESFVVFLCVAQLFEVGYKPANIKLEGKNYQGNDLGWTDILVSDNYGEEYLIIECKTSDVKEKNDEFRKHWTKTLRDGDQLFRYFNTYRKAKYLCLFSADYVEYKTEGGNKYQYENIYNIISLIDNEEYLKTNPKLKSFTQMRKNQGSSDDFFKVWKDTYLQDYNTRGLLEKGIEPFNIGKKGYSISDLNTITEYSLGKKYNEFALILRKHTISSHENAFDKLVNLFIAKIIDEERNPKELKLLWKGAAYDDYFSLQDRLNVLYREGMRVFFNDDVTYIENKQIDDAFKFLSAKADEGKETIKRYFRQLKYFNNNPFAFLDVHNEQLFFKNAVILKDVINMMQDIYLTSNENNQFLGDLFEGFLNKGVHQSEGQFFTPIPIVKFLVSSLPLRNIVDTCNSVPRVIDYACGAGHFLTEYASQIRDIVNEENKNISDEKDKIDISQYYKQIIGIEKDYRLSKVSQVAAFMYGMDGIRIHFADGLTDTKDIIDHTFNILIANPPYAVPGFLENLTEDERNQYRLTTYVSNIEKNKTIETFFVERAEKLLATNGVAAIILPSSVLTNGGIYMRTREILLQKFDIVAICGFGPNTFGQTGTNTVTLFLRRKAIEPDMAKQYKNRIDAWFSGNMTDDDYYNDHEILEAYVDHMSYNLDDYLEMLRGILTAQFKENGIVVDYLKALNIFQKNKNESFPSLSDEAKDIRKEAQAKAKGRDYKAMTPAGQQKLIESYEVKFVKAIEKEKLYYFMLAYSNPQPVVTMSLPVDKKGKIDKKAEKQFLGYEWSNRKGNEGIHYLNTGKLKKSSESGEDEDDETLVQITNINGIQTPLFNPKDLSDNGKINTIIRGNYNNEDIEIPEELSEYIKVFSLSDMLDFTRVEFDKVISGKVRKQKLIESKYDQVKLSDICVDIFAGGDRPDNFSSEPTDKNKVPVYSNGVVRDGLYGYTDNPRVKEPCVSISARGTLGYCVCHKEPIFPIVRLIVAIPNNKVSIDYLYEILTHVDYINEGASTPQLSVPKVKNYKVPLPPLSVQYQIVEECKAEDKVYKDSKEEVEKLKAQLDSMFAFAQAKASDSYRLSQTDLFEISIGRRVLKSEVVAEGKYDVYSANVFVPFGKTETSVLDAFDRASVLWGIDGDWMVNYLPENIPFNPTDHCGVIRVLDRDVVNPRYLAYVLQKVGEEERFSRSKRASTERIKTLNILLPQIGIQNEVANKSLEIDKKIRELEAKISDASSIKQAILDKYLR